MKRKRYFLLWVLPIVLFLSSFTPLNENDYLQKDSNTYEDIGLGEELDAIYESFLSMLPFDFEDKAFSFAGVEELLSFFDDFFAKEGGGIASVFFKLIGIALFFVLAQILTADAGELSASVQATVSVCLSLPVLLIAKDTLYEVKAGIESGSEFFSGIIPLMSAVLAAGASPTAAAASSGTMSISLAFISGFLCKNLLPVATLIFSVSLVSGFDTAGGISIAAKGIRSWFNFGIGLASLLLVATLTFQCTIGAYADTMALRGVKYAASNMIPIVGSVVSGALSTLASGIKLLSSFIGVGSVIMMLIYMGAPLLALLFYRFALGAAASLCAMSGASFGQRFFESVRGALDCIIGILASSLLIYILEIILLAWTAGRIM